MVGRHTIDKEASEIGVGDIVFCQVQNSQQFYAHIVLSVEWDYHANETKYWIGNIEQKHNGWCFREHIFGILVEVQKEWLQQSWTRPHHKQLYPVIKEMIKDNRWNSAAWQLCEPVYDAAG